jgi:hypothetical protein
MFDRTAVILIATSSTNSLRWRSIRVGDEEGSYREKAWNSGEMEAVAGRVGRRVVKAVPMVLLADHIFIELRFSANLCT